MSPDTFESTGESEIDYRHTLGPFFLKLPCIPFASANRWSLLTAAVLKTCFCVTVSDLYFLQFIRYICVSERTETINAD